MRSGYTWARVAAAGIGLVLVVIPEPATTALGMGVVGASLLAGEVPVKLRASRKLFAKAVLGQPHTPPTHLMSICSCASKNCSRDTRDWRGSALTG